MKTSLLLFVVLTLALCSCKKEDLSLSGTPSAIGAVGNELSFTHNIPGIGGITAAITSIDDGVSTISATFEVTNDDFLAIITEVASLYPAHLTVTGNSVSSSMKARFTTDGIAWVHDSGEELVVCKYDAEVDDEWTMKVDGKNVRHKVSEKSSEDDYEWGFWLLKVVTMNATGYGLPGLNRVEYISNHRFGPVGVKGYLSDGSSLEAAIFSLFDNQ